MSVCGISQPVYLPWVGYFNLILQSDKFVFLDDAQFSKNSFGNRNRVPTSQGPTWLTIPILKGNLEKTFNESYFDETQNWRSKHLKTLQLLYGKSPSFSAVFEILEGGLQDESLNTLASMSIYLTTSLVTYLGVKKEFFRSSQLNIPGQRSNRILKICQTLGCSDYLSALGAQEYIEEDKVLGESGLKVQFQHIEPKPYPQLTTKEFQSHMSIIDLLFNLKKSEALSYILSIDQRGAKQ